MRAVVVACLLILGLASPAQAATRTVPPSIAADCSVNVTGPLQQWLDASADGDTLYFPAGACYRVDGELKLTDRHDLILRGQGALLRTSKVPPAFPKTGWAMWRITGGSGIEVYNMVLKSSNPQAAFDVNREWFPLFNIEGTRDLIIKNVRGSNSWGDFASIGPDGRGTTSSDGTGAILPDGVTIQNSTATTIGRHGITCNGCANVTVDNNTFTDVAYQVVDVEVEASTWYARAVAFTNNTIAGRVALSVLATGSTEGVEISGITISGNTMTGVPASCASSVHVEDTPTPRRNWTITGNRFRTLSTAYRLQGLEGVIVNDNVTTFGSGGCDTGGVAIFGTNGTAYEVKRNDFNGATRLFQVGATVTRTACGNRLTGTGFDRPVPC